MPDRPKLRSRNISRQPWRCISRPKTLAEMLARPCRPNQEEIDRQLDDLARLIAGASDAVDGKDDE